MVRPHKKPSFRDLNLYMRPLALCNEDVSRNVTIRDQELGATYPATRLAMYDTPVMAPAISAITMEMTVITTAARII